MGKGEGSREGGRERLRIGHRDWASGGGSGLGIGIGVGMGVGMGWGSDHLGDGGDAAHEDPKGCGLALPDMVSFRGASLVPV